ncbi:hypothetical protein CH274_15575 [Rhodococcus sp. 06-418-5]|uniref:recombinase RecT n=1 Tax=Rhodococcus sp. 06-418-5 TaxID=2022507 RepID=UPI000B9B2630|nr:recombinase RecT [Rhodococcus sp. 06-418-5]OZC80588.1 hypothetical protein CH274_15575 [Rhodococcus sp. 06-418-5]
MTADVSPVNTTPKSDLAITSDQSTFTPKQIAALEQLGISNAPQGDIDLFFHRCQVTKLDPFSRQIYMIGRKTNDKKYNPATREYDDNWVVKYTIQTGIDGYRLNGMRAARKRGDKISIGSPTWRGREGGWDDVWLDKDHPPLAARFTITVNGETFTATAMYHEYVQYVGSGNSQRPNSMWAKMPANQIAKCAEAACWRKAYPDDFSDLVLEDAAQVIDEEGNRVTVESERVGNGAKGARAAMGLEQRPEPVDITATHTEAQKEPAPVKRTTERTKNRASSASSQASASNQGAKVDPHDAPATPGQVTALGKLFKKEGYDDFAAQLQWLQGNAIVQDDITGLDGLNGAQAAVAIETLQ